MLVQGIEPREQLTLTNELIIRKWMISGNGVMLALKITYLLQCLLQFFVIRPIDRQFA